VRNILQNSPCNHNNTTQYLTDYYSIKMIILLLLLIFLELSDTNSFSGVLCT